MRTFGAILELAESELQFWTEMPFVGGLDLVESHGNAFGSLFFATHKMRVSDFMYNLRGSPRQVKRERWRRCFKRHATGRAPLSRKTERGGHGKREEEETLEANTP